MAVKQYWLLKTEPSTFSWNDLLREAATKWDGVRNFQARNHLRAMHVGDRALIYHSGDDKAVIGIAEITREAYPDSSDGDWSVVDVRPVSALAKPVPLTAIKAHKALSGMTLLRQSRLSVCPCTAEEFKLIVQLGSA